MAASLVVNGGLKDCADEEKGQNRFQHHGLGDVAVCQNAFGDAKIGRRGQQRYQQYRRCNACHELRCNVSSSRHRVYLAAHQQAHGHCRVKVRARDVPIGVNGPDQHKAMSQRRHDNIGPCARNRGDIHRKSADEHQCKRA